MLTALIEDGLASATSQDTRQRRRWVPVAVCGEEFFRHRLPFDRSSMTDWRNRMGAERLLALLQESFTDDDSISSPRVGR
jgi:hypothetical protein